MKKTLLIAPFLVLAANFLACSNSQPEKQDVFNPIAYHMPKREKFEVIYIIIKWEEVRAMFAGDVNWNDKTLILSAKRDGKNVVVTYKGLTTISVRAPKKVEAGEVIAYVYPNGFRNALMSISVKKDGKPVAPPTDFPPLNLPLDLSSLK